MEFCKDLFSPSKTTFLDAEQLVFSWTQLLFPEGSPAPEGKWSFSSTSSFPQPRQSQSGGWIIFSPCLTSGKPYLNLIFYCFRMYWFHDVYCNFKHAMRRTSYIVIMKKTIIMILYLQTTFWFWEHWITWFGWWMMMTTTTRQWLLCAARRATRKKK